MSIEQAMIVRARPDMLAARARAMIGQEAAKGCSALLSSSPVALEPPFRLLRTAQDIAWDGEESAAEPEPIPAAGDLLRFRIWISPEQKFEWNRSELMLKLVSRSRRRVGFEIVGNKEAVSLQILCHQCDVPVVHAAISGVFAHCEVSSAEHPQLTALLDDPSGRVLFRDYYPLPPYSHLLTRPSELKVTPFETLLAAMRLVPEGSVALYQCMFQGVQSDHNWHRNVQSLVDIEFVIRSLGSTQVVQRYLQQAPSGDLRNMAMEVENKAHNDKPLFSAAARVCLLADATHGEELLSALASFAGLIQHGGHTLEFLSHEDYATALSTWQLRRMLRMGLVYRSGFLVNSEELTTLAHVFPIQVTEDREVEFEALDVLSRASDRFSEGTCIGECRRTGEDRKICIPHDIRRLSTHIIASPGMGKSWVMVNMILQDIKAGHATVFIDPHGDAIHTLLPLIPPECYERVVYFKPGDPEWVPLWNPMKLAPGADMYRFADDIVAVFKRVVKDWGDRMEHVIRYGLLGLLYLGDMTLLDLYNLTRQKSPESEQLRRQIVRAARDEPVRRFWQHDFLGDYRKADLTSPRHKLSKLLSGGAISLMLSQSESRIDFGEIMDERKILLIDLSSLGAEVRELLGSVILSQLFVSILRRTDTAEAVRQFVSLFVDEFHLLTDAETIDQLIVEIRKFNVNLCGAHQFLRQFSARKVDALSSMGSTIIGRVDTHDAQFLAKNLQEKVKAADLVNLEPHEMIARIGTEIVKIRTLELPEAGEGHDPTRIIEESRRRYCKPIDEVEREIASRDQQFARRFGPAFQDDGADKFTAEDLAYEEF